jgi:hypothetical protein
MKIAFSLPAIIVLAGAIPWKRLNPADSTKWIGSESAA